MRLFVVVLSKGLDLDSRAFSRYRAARAHLESRTAAAIPGHVLEDKRRRAARAFVEDFNEASASRRVVFALDTAEALQRESEPVAALVEAEEQTTATLVWLLNELGNLKNCVVLVAGRPPGFVDDFLSKYGSVSGQFECMELSGLTWHETQVYFDRLANESPALKGLPLDLRWRIWRMSGGRPLRMVLALEVYQYGDLSALFGLSADQQVGIDKQLLSGLLAQEEATRLIFLLLAIARKGVNTELLHFITPRWSAAECQARLALIQNRSLVKVRAGVGDLFLHDEVYELFDLHILPEMNIRPWFARLTAYYRALLEKTKDRTERADWIVALLYYELHFDPQRAYEELYLPSSEVALKGHELDLDLRLRDEVLRFMSRPANPASGSRQGLSQAEVDRDSAARWVRRHIARGQYDRARRVAERLLELANLPFDTADPRFRGEVLVYYGEALLYLGAPESLVVTALGQAIELLEPTTQSVSETRRSWWQSRLLGTAHNSLGYYHWSAQHYRRAIHEFSQAIAYFRRTDIQDELADSLNNLAFVRGLLGESAQAEALMTETLALRREQNQQYRLALSLNTYGLITLINGDLWIAERHCTEALTIFEKLGDSRGIGLACIALGQIRRQLAAGAQSAEVDKAFSLGESLLERALNIFTTAVKEPIREAEARLEIGCLHREWGLALKSAGDPNASQPHFEAARRALERVVEMAGPWPVTRVEACLQVARLWHGQGAVTEALGWLEKAEQLIPAEYRSSISSHTTDISEPIEGFWLMLGEISLTRGQIVLEENIEDDDRQIESVVENFVQGFDFIIKFSPSAPALKRHQKDLIRGLSRQSAPILTRAKLLIASYVKNFPQAASILMAIIDEAHARSVTADNRRRYHE
jgi:tetratricopeptide (TPR) repeat protein